MHIASLFLVLIPGLASAQDWNTTVPKDIVILRSTKSYDAALQTAKAAATKMGKPLKLEGYRPNATIGLSLSRADCEGDGYDYPCYTARGDGDAANSDYISIEYSTAYQSLAPGYYIVVAGIGTPGSPATRQVVTAAKRYFPDAYAKRTRVWFGCMH